MSEIIEREVISIPASQTIDIIHKYRIHAHPNKLKGYNYKPALYYTFRRQGGIMEKLFTLDFTFSFNPYDDLIKISDIISDVGKMERVLDYIKDRKKDYGFKHPNTEYKFYLFDEEINLPKQMIKLNQNNHCYFTLNEIFSENEVIKSTEKKTIISFKNITGIPQEVCSDKPYFEGTVEKIIVNKYERNHKARQECLKHYGYKCCICDFNFLDKYGDIAKEIIEVHHLKKISSINSEYKVDPIKDLRPVCPNCHTVIHSREPIYEIVELKGIVNNRKN